MRLVVDTNVVIHALRNEGPARQFLKFGPVVHTFLYHEEQLVELRDVAARPRLSISHESVDEWMDRIKFYGERVETSLAVTGACRDPNDDYLLTLAHAGLAEIIISEDEDLLVLSRWQGIRIMRLFQFLADYPLPVRLSSHFGRVAQVGTPTWGI